MARLCAIADIIIPNVTEACLLTNTEYRESYDEKYATDLLKKLCSLGAKKAVLTGIKLQNHTQGALCYDSESDSFCSYFAEQMPLDFHGTGDTFASVFTGALTRGFSLDKALEASVDFTVECIRATIPYATEHSYGTMFESSIPFLISKINELEKR